MHFFKFYLYIFNFFFRTVEQITLKLQHNNLRYWGILTCSRHDEIPTSDNLANHQTLKFDELYLRGPIILKLMQVAPNPRRHNQKTGKIYIPNMNAFYWQLWWTQTHNKRCQGPLHKLIGEVKIRFRPTSQKFLTQSCKEHLVNNIIGLTCN